MSRKKGNVAEQRACEYLVDNGFFIITQNFYSRFGEIDIVASKGGVLHFVEVKSGDDYEKAVQNITRTKLSKLIKTGSVYMKKNALDVEFEYDAIIVTPDGVEMIENITL